MLSCKLHPHNRNHSVYEYGVLFWLNKNLYMSEFIAIVVRMQKFALLSFVDVIWNSWPSGKSCFSFIYGLWNVKVPNSCKWGSLLCIEPRTSVSSFCRIFGHLFFEFSPLEKIKNNIWTLHNFKYSFNIFYFSLSLFYYQIIFIIHTHIYQTLYLF